MWSDFWGARDLYGFHQAQNYLAVFLVQEFHVGARGL